MVISAGYHENNRGYKQKGDLVVGAGEYLRLDTIPVFLCAP